MTGYLSIRCEGNSMVGATGHISHSLTKEVGGHESRGQSVVGRSIAQLAVTIVAPSKNFSIYKAVDKYFISKWLLDEI